MKPAIRIFVLIAIRSTMKNFFCVILLTIFSFSCKKEDSSDIPNVMVDFTIYITDPQFSALNSVNRWVYVSGGVQGIIIYRHTLDEFFAIERNCSYQPSHGDRVSVDTTNTTFLRDAVCGSKFNMVNGGSVENGPATRPLKRYNATYDGTNAVHVYNY